MSTKSSEKNKTTSLKRKVVSKEEIKEKKKKQIQERKKKEEEEPIVISTDAARTIQTKITSLMQFETEAQSQLAKKKEIENEKKEVGQLIKTFKSNKVNLWDIGWEVKDGFEKPTKITQKMIKEAIRIYFNDDEDDDHVEQYKEAKKQKREIAQASGARQYSVRVLPIEKEKEQELNKKRSEARTNKKLTKTVSKIKTKLSSKNSESNNNNS